MGLLSNITVVGKHVGEFKHKHLCSAWRRLRRNMPWLWIFYDYPEAGIPNTNNVLERLNGIIKDLLRRHRGISLAKRKQLIREKLKEACNPHRKRQLSRF